MASFTSLVHSRDDLSEDHMAMEARKCPDPTNTTRDRDEISPGRRTLAFHIKTVFLITQGDFKCVILPQSLFAISTVYSGADVTTTAVLRSLTMRVAMRLPFMMLWLWIHLLLEDTANQRMPDSVSEDSVNKPWRPLPSKRVSAREMTSGLRMLVPIAATFSLFLGSFTPSVSFMVLVWLYNDLDAANVSPWQRNLMNAVGLACFGWGASETLRFKEEGGSLSPACLRNWLLMMIAATATTIHAQDFPDMEGDRERNRQTFPLAYGEDMARSALAIAVIGWSVASLCFWNVRSSFVWASVLGVGTVMASMTMMGRSIKWDKTVWKLWCGWMSLLYILPCAGAIM